ncbi:MAG: hypothetical protein U0992_07200 [Planctomycetaceae bacterium]
MFGLSRNSVSRSSIPKPDLASPEVQDDPQAEFEQGQSPHPADAATPPQGQSPARPAVQSASSAPAHSEDVSIEAYMERLLARSRPHLEVPKDLLADGPSLDNRPRGKEQAEEAAVEPVTPHVTKVFGPEEREALRANLDSFRELANISARSAVAKHQSAKLQSVVQVKMIVLVISAGVTLALWIAGWFSPVSYLFYTTAAALATIVMLADVVRTTLAISQLKSLEAAGEAENVAGEAENVAGAAEDVAGGLPPQNPEAEVPSTPDAV